MENYSCVLMSQGSDWFCERLLFCGPGVMVLCTAWILHMCRWGFACLRGPILGRLWMGACLGVGGLLSQAEKFLFSALSYTSFLSSKINRKAMNMEGLKIYFSHFLFLLKTLFFVYSQSSEQRVLEYKWICQQRPV